MKISILGLGAAAGLVLSQHASAFSLIGAPDASQVTELGYFANGNGGRTFSQQGDLGGPRNLGGEFRWSTPVITYGFDATFIDFFGAEGVAAVQKAFAILNALKPASQMSAGLGEFPLKTSGVNFAAQRLHMYDVKSFTLSIMMEQLGLAAPERYVWCLKQRVTVNNINNFLVFNRNYDPVSQNYSPFVNGTRYSFVVGQFTLPDGTVYYDTRKVAIDAAEPNLTVVALNGIAGGILGIDDRVKRMVSYNSGNVEGTAGIGAWGLYFSGLTRDDAGAIRYLLDPRNKNYESAPAGSAAPSGLPVSVVSGGGSGSDAWRIIDTLPSGAGGSGGNSAPSGGGGTTNATVTPFINESLRPGVDKINFVQVNLDPLTRRTVLPVAVQYSESIVTNGVTVSQRVERIQNRPDILFSAADLGANGVLPFVYSRNMNFSQPSRSAQDVINNPVNALNYPGNIGGTVDVTFAAMGPYYITRDVGSNQGDSNTGFVWGSFDGTTNRPVAYPVGRVDLLQLEQAALKEN